MIATLLGLWRGGSLAKYAVGLAVLAAVFLAGVGVGNVRATRHLVEDVQKRADAQFAAATYTAAKQANEANAKLKTAIADARRSDDAAIKTVRLVSQSARADHEAVAAQLTMEKPDAPASCPAYQWSPDARSVLDRAAGVGTYILAPHRDPDTDTAGGVVGNGSAANEAPGQGR
jgi:Lon protease-like protein